MSNDATTRMTTGRELWGIALVTFSILAGLALASYQWQDIGALRAPPQAPPMNFIGPAGAWFVFVTLMALGLGAYLLPLLTLVAGLGLIAQPDTPVRPTLLWGGQILLALCGLLQLHPGLPSGVCQGLNLEGLAGGLLAWLAFDRGLALWMGVTGATVVAVALGVTGLVLLVGQARLREGALYIWTGLRLLQGRWDDLRDARRNCIEKIDREERDIEKQRAQLEKELRNERKTGRPATEKIKPIPPDPVLEAKPLPIRIQPVVDPIEPTPPPKPKPVLGPAPSGAARGETLKAEIPRATEKTPPAVAPPAPPPVIYTLPGMDKLQPLPANVDRGITIDHDTIAGVIRQTLNNFDIACEMTGYVQGPTVTRYELRPSPGVKVEKINGLSNNLAMVLKAPAVRIQAPVPGKDVVGIEVPNTTSTKVFLRELLEADRWRAFKGAIPLVIGKDVGGKDLVYDLAAMPHLLIAGATGSGKTVCMNTILAGMLMSRTPDQLRMILVDPKIVEFSVYNHLPHLVVPVITDSKKVALGLRWAILKMEDRYKMFARAGVRNIQAFNTRTIPAGTPIATDESDPATLPAAVPYIVIIIDELADLMMVARQDIENHIARLAQLARAVGIHMILATQRPSVNVITGTIKANFPARISFQVAQANDSKTILDHIGAEKLLGKGDMLVLPPDTRKLMRAQGAMTSDDDIATLAAFWKTQGEPAYEMALKASLDSAAKSDDEDEAHAGGDGEGGEDENDGDDDLIRQSVAIIRETRRASVSMLQRRMKIGFNRAGRLMDKLEQRGVVGPARGSDPREILIDLDASDIPGATANETPMN